MFLAQHDIGTTASLPPNTRIDRYEIRSLLGKGGMGEVYLAKDLRLHRKVALKILPAELAADRDRMRRFGARGHGRCRTQSSAHRANFRNRPARGHALHRDGVGRWGLVAREDPYRTYGTAKAAEVFATGGRGFGKSARVWSQSF